MPFGVNFYLYLNFVILTLVWNSVGMMRFFSVYFPKRPRHDCIVENIKSTRSFISARPHPV